MRYFNLKDGDVLEKNYYEFIINNLPSYKMIWEAFVGNDGHSKLPPISGLTEEQMAKRHHINQNIYSILEALVINDRIIKYFDNIDLVEDYEFEPYINQIEKFYLFWMNIGRVRDLLKNFITDGRYESMSSEMQIFYNQRSTVLHESKIPFYYKDGIIYTVIPAGTNHCSEIWQKGSKWVDASKMKSEMVITQIISVNKKILILTEKVFGKISSEIICPILNGIKNDDPGNVFDGLKTDHFSPTISGMSQPSGSLSR
jgi:hypothetical protein